MGILATIDRQIQDASYNDREGWFADWLRGDTDSDSGASVNERTAMQIATVYKCVDWRAKMFGMLPKKIFESVEILGRSAQKEAPKHPLFDLIHAAPNPTITACSWFGLISADVHLWGNSYAYIERGRYTAKIIGLWRILPDAVRIEQDYATGQIWYMVSYAQGQEERFYPDEILHIRGLGFDGIRGYSIRIQSKTLGWAKATRQFSAKFYKNAFRPSGLLISPQAFRDKKVKEDLVANLKASGKDGGLALVEGALEYKPLGIPQDDAQFLQTAEFQDEDICGIMGVKPHKVGILRHMTNNNVEQQNIEAVTDCIQPFAVSVEQQCDMQLLSDRPSSGLGGGTERSRFFMQCELKALLRGDTAAQTAHIEKMIDKGVYSDNDARDYLGIAPYPGGDRYWMNAAYVPIDRIDEILDKKSAPPAPIPANQTDANAPDPNSGKNALGILLRDAIGRVLHRPSKDRERSAPAILRPCVMVAAEIFGGSEERFVEDYASAMSMRSSLWKESSLDSTVTEEADRLSKALLEKRQ